MNEETTPFGLSAFGNSPGMAPAVAPENIELSDSIPVAFRPDEIAREATRYLVFVGDIIVPRQKRERPDLRLGGEYFGQQYRTLVRSKYLLRRCQITPLEIAFDFINDEIMGDNPNHLHVVDSITNHDVNPSLNQRANLLGSTKLNAVQVFPGDEIKGMLLGDRNADEAKGIVEVKRLAGVLFDDFRQSGIQQFIFPNWDKIVAGVDSLPTKLSELQQHLTSRKNETGDADLREVIEAYQLSADQYREWGTRYLKYAAQLVRLTFTTGFVHTYSDLAEMLFDQLEIRREDLLSSDRDIADIVARAQAGSAISGGEVTALLQKMSETQDMLARVLVTGKPTEAPATAAVAETQPAVTARRCAAINRTNGEQCSRDAVEGSDYCEHPYHQALAKQEVEDTGLNGQ